MGPILLLSILLQIGCGVHVVRTGRPLYWIFILLIGSYIGVLVYLLAEVLPELRSNRGANRALGRVRDRIDPTRHTRAASRDLEIADTLDNRRRLAERKLDDGDYAGAETLYREALRGLYATDPTLMLGLAQAQFHRGEPSAARETLDALIAANPDFRSHDGHLLYARAVEAGDDFTAAVEEYEALVQDYPGEEARVRYAGLLQRNGQADKARALYADTLRRVDLAPAYYRREQREWVEIAKREARD
ncbi:MAG: tetratricopeptide repeat protein [Luteimonas sp.]